VRRHQNRPVLITDAERSQEDQLRIREIRYVLMMSVRVVSVLVAVALFALQPPGLWIWLALCGIGMVVVPWAAVVLANDRLPKEQHRWRRYRPGGRRQLRTGPTAPAPQSGLAAGPTPAASAQEDAAANGYGSGATDRDSAEVIDVDPPAGRPG
jgi:hypothetical protein